MIITLILIYLKLPRCLPIGRRFFATSATLPPRNYAQIIPPYETLVSNLSVISKTILGSRPLTQTEKILYAHIWDPNELDSIVRGETYIKLRPGDYLFWSIWIQHGDNALDLFCL